MGLDAQTLKLEQPTDVCHSLSLSFLGTAIRPSVVTRETSPRIQERRITASVSRSTSKLLVPECMAGSLLMRRATDSFVRCRRRPGTGSIVRAGDARATRKRTIAQPPRGDGDGRPQSVVSILHPPFVHPSPSRWTCVVPHLAAHRSASPQSTRCVPFLSPLVLWSPGVLPSFLVCPHAASECNSGGVSRLSGGGSAPPRDPTLQCRTNDSGSPRADDAHTQRDASPSPYNRFNSVVNHS